MVSVKLILNKDVFRFLFHGRGTNKNVFFPEESYIRHSDFTVISKAVIKFIRDRRPIYCEVQHCRLSQFSKNDGELVSSIVESHEVSSIQIYSHIIVLERHQ